MNQKTYATIVAQSKPCKQPRLSERQSPQKSPQQLCPHCGSTNLIIGAGKKPGEESRRCGDCKHFLGYSPLAKLKKAIKRKKLTQSLEILEAQGIESQDEQLFLLSAIADGGEA